MEFIFERILVFEIFEKGQILRHFSGLAPSKIKNFRKNWMVAYVHIEYSSYQFSEESKGGGVESILPPPGPCYTFAHIFYLFEKNYGLVLPLFLKIITNCMSKKFWTILYSNLSYEIGQDFLDKQELSTAIIIIIEKDLSQSLNINVEKKHNYLININKHLLKVFKLKSQDMNYKPSVLILMSCILRVWCWVRTTEKVVRTYQQILYYLVSLECIA